MSSSTSSQLDLDHGNSIGWFRRYVTFSGLAGVDSSDKWSDPDTKFVHDVDGIDQWPSIISGEAQPRTLPTTHKSLLVDDGKGHMYKLINGNETRADRFHKNGSVYEDPYHECLPGNFNGSYGIQFDCINSLGQGGGGGRMSCVVCSNEQPCLVGGNALPVIVISQTLQDLHLRFVLHAVRRPS